MALAVGETTIVRRSLVEQAAAGDQQAFEDLVRQSADRLFAIAWRILRDYHKAEDAVQQTLATIWDELPRLRDPDRFEAWSYRLVVRISIAEAKRARQAGPMVRLLPDDVAMDTGSSRPSDDIGAVADRDQVQRGLLQLTPDQRAALILQHYLGLSLAEIADVLGIPIGTAGSRLHYAAQALRAAIDADGRAIGQQEWTA
jgi:RNA polymerase sigma-70 factor (ECF subfamily)